MAETNGFLELLLSSILDNQVDARRLLAQMVELQHTNREAVVTQLSEMETRLTTALLASSASKPDQITEPLKLLDRIFSLGPVVWQGAIWVWHVILWLFPRCSGVGGSSKASFRNGLGSRASTDDVHREGQIPQVALPRGVHYLRGRQGARLDARQLLRFVLCGSVSLPSPRDDMPPVTGPPVTGGFSI